MVKIQKLISRNIHQMTDTKFCHEHRLLHYDQVPVIYREHCIFTGYRKPWCTARECLASAFYPTNETLNFWTHFVPFWYFVYTFCVFIGDPEYIWDPYYWPFLAYMLTVCTWPALSCIAHLFSYMSETSRHICFFIDYLGLSWYSFGAGAAHHAYCFPSNILSGWFSTWFIRISVLSAILSTFLACFSRFIALERLELRKFMKICAFGIPYVVVNGPLLYRMIQSTFYGVGDESLWWHWSQILCISSSIIIYWSHLPERWFPRKFDLIGHSHQLFHIFGVLATYCQMWAVKIDLTQRREYVENSGNKFRTQNDVKWTVAVLVVDCWVVILFTAVLIFSRNSSRCNSQNTNSLQCKNK